jgi:hypothetical protein
LAEEGWLWRTGFAQLGKNAPHAHALVLCGRSLAKLALTEREIKSIKVPVRVVVGNKDDLIKRLYVDSLPSVRQETTAADRAAIL